MAQNDFSSTAREITGFHTALTELQRSDALSHITHIQLWTNSQAAYAACVNMHGIPLVFAAVRKRLKQNACMHQGGDAGGELGSGNRVKMVACPRHVEPS